MSRLEQAFNEHPRSGFLPADKVQLSSTDSPIPIGYNQTNSQPTTVRRMLAWLDVKPGQKVLDVGSGSGWTTALLSHITGDQGRVYAVEKVPELVIFGKENCQKQDVKNVAFFEAGETYGLPDYAPYDRILVSAAANTIPQELVDQLKPGGRMVIPVKSSIYVVEKHTDNSVHTTEHFGYAFVPLI